MDTQLTPDLKHWTTAPLRISTETLIDAPQNAIFRALSDPDRMCQLFPWMHQITLDYSKQRSESTTAVVQGYYSGSGRSESMTRTCFFGNGLYLEEEIVFWDAPHGYIYRGIDETNPFGMQGYVASIVCEPTETGTRLIWTHHFDHSQPAAMVDQLVENIKTALNRLLTIHGGTPIRWTLQRQ